MPALKFSVLMSVYKNDKPEWFAQAMESIVCQTRLPDEVILVVDGPIPSCLVKAINFFLAKHPKILRVIWLEKNCGLGISRKIGLENCSHNLVAFMDSDDIASNNRFERQIACFQEDGDLSLVGGLISEFIDSPENIIGIRKVPEKDFAIKEYLKSRCPFNHVTVMLKRDSALEAGNFLDWYCNEDYYLWVRMFLKGYKFYNLQEVLVNVRVGKEMYERRGGMKYFKSEAKLQIFMWRNGIISVARLFINVFIRLLVQVLMPNYLRGFVFRTLFRAKTA